MKKRTYLLPLVSTLLLSPALLNHHVSAQDDNTPVSATNNQPNAEKDLVILHTNDIHGRLEEDKRGKVIGVAKLDTVVQGERAKNEQTTLVVDAGDALQGLPISNNTKGEDMVSILNEIGYDAIAVGNHEFDFGFDQAIKYKQLFKFPILSANTYVNGARVFQSHEIVDKDKTVVGDEVVIIGVTTPETYTKTHPKNIANVEFRDPITEVKQVIEQIESEARANNKEYKNYIILGHLGIDDTTKKEWQGSTMAEELSKFEPVKNKRVVVIDGHSHTVSANQYGHVVYNQTGNYLNNIGKVTLKADGTHKPALITYKDTENITPSATIAQKVADIKEKFNKDNAVVVVEKNSVELNGKRENVRVRETNLGNVVTDALYAYGQTGFKNQTDLAVTNGGGLRETIKKDAPITKGDIIAVLPFGNIISQIEVKGSQILDMFKHSLSAVLQNKDNKPVLDENGLPLLEANGSFLHISGAKVYFDPTLDAKERVLRVKILDKKTGNYVPLDVNKTYYLATNDFVAAGGDGYTMLGGAKEEGPSMDAVFAEFLKDIDLTKYAVVNPNERIISLTKENFDKLEKEEKEKAEKENDQPKHPKRVASPLKDIIRRGSGIVGGAASGNASGGAFDDETNEQSSTTSKTDKTVVTSKTLPNTGETSSFVAFGLLSVLAGFGLFKRSKKQ